MRNSCLCLVLRTQGKNLFSNYFNNGFTLLEVCIIILLIGILGAIAVPTWLAFLDTQRLNVAQNQAYLAFRQAQSQAKQEGVTVQISFREYSVLIAGEYTTVTQWAIHDATISPAQAQWYNFDQDIILDPETTLEDISGVKYIQFNFLGAVRQPPLGRLTLSSKYGGHSKRCVFVSTILGALRTAKEHPNPSDGRYCY